jgi:hypothetical protein
MPWIKVRLYTSGKSGKPRGQAQRWHLISQSSGEKAWSLCGVRPKGTRRWVQESREAQAGNPLPGEPTALCGTCEYIAAKEAARKGQS